MNPSNGIDNGFPTGSHGNAFPMFGTGQLLYAQLGYLFRTDWLGAGKGTILPYISWMCADFDRLSDRMNVIDLGVNWLIKGHSSKLTLDYQSRPVYEQRGDDLIKSGTRSQVVLQYQISF
jgi:hypothetical protein